MYGNVDWMDVLNGWKCSMGVGVEWMKVLIGRKLVQGSVVGIRARPAVSGRPLDWQKCEEDQAPNVSDACARIPLQRPRAGVSLCLGAQRSF